MWVGHEGRRFHQRRSEVTNRAAGVKTKCNPRKERYGRKPVGKNRGGFATPPGKIEGRKS